MATRIGHPWQFFMRAPLVIVVNKLLWMALKDFGWSTWDAIALSSSIAGGVFAWGLFRITRSPWVWGVCLLSKGVLVFVGHVENYAWPYALSIWCFALLKESLEEGRPLLPVWLLAGVSTLFHPMVLMIWPGLFWGARPWNRRWLSEALLALTVTILIFDFFLVIGNVFGFFRLSWIVSLSDSEGTLCPYGILSWEHLELILGFHLWTLPIGLPLLLLFGHRIRQGWKGGLLVTAGITFLWSLVWCPSMGVADWDLFAWPALFINLAGGLAWVEKTTAPDEEYSTGAGD
ncbi:MAG: hypothetical protein GHCLOJNM_02152 [bacterium]|nr:hypothetical protein [bacterium]